MDTNKILAFRYALLQLCKEHSISIVDSDGDRAFVYIPYDCKYDHEILNARVTTEDDLYPKYLDWKWGN